MEKMFTVSLVRNLLGSTRLTPRLGAQCSGTRPRANKTCRIHDSSVAVIITSGLLGVNPDSREGRPHPIQMGSDNYSKSELEGLMDDLG